MTVAVLSSVAFLLCGSIPLQLHLDTRRGWREETSTWHGDGLVDEDPPEPLPTRIAGATLDEATLAMGPVDDEAPLDVVEAVASSWWMRPRYTYTDELWQATAQPTAAVTKNLGGRRGRHRASWWRRLVRTVRGHFRVVESQASFVRWSRRAVNA